MSYFYFELHTDKITFNLGAGFNNGENYDFVFGGVDALNPAEFRYFEWNHFVIVKSAVDTYVYLNNNLVFQLGTNALSALSGRAITDNRIGYDGGAYYAFDLDQYREYSRELRAEEVDLLYYEEPYTINIGNPGFINRLSDNNFSFADGAFEMFDNKIYLFGGRNGSDAANNNFQTYDTQTNVPTSVTTVGKPSARYGSAMARYQNKLYVFGGINGVTYYSDLYAYDFHNDVWETLTSNTVALTGHKFVKFEDDIYVFGGIKSDGNYNTSVYKYTPATDTWVEEAAGVLWKNSYMPAHNNVYIKDAFFFGHNDAGTLKDEVWKYNFNDKAFTQVSTGRGKTGLVGAQSSLIDNKLFVIGGYNQTGTVNENRLMTFDVKTLSWEIDRTQHVSYIHKANGSIITFSNAIYVLGGFNESRNSVNSTFVYFGRE